jgi:hypothetical protein
MRRFDCAAVLAAVLAAPAARADVSGAEAPRLDNHASDRFRGELGAAPLLALGLTPALGSGVSFSTGFRWTSFSVAVEGRLISSFGEESAGNVVLGASIAMPALDVCAHRGALSACTVFDVGELRMDSDPRFRIEARDPWGTSIGLRAGAEWPFSNHVALRGFLELHAQFGRPSVWVNNMEAWRAPPVFGLVGAGLMFPLEAL